MKFEEEDEELDDEDDELLDCDTFEDDELECDKFEDDEFECDKFEDDEIFDCDRFTECDESLRPRNRRRFNAINEMASKAGVGVVLEQEAIPIREEVHAVSEMLGIDPFEVANEGKVVMGVKADKAEAVLEAIKGEKYGENAVIIGEVVEGDYVVVNTPIGGERILEAPIADPVPRVC
jgi:hypothetical protein